MTQPEFRTSLKQILSAGTLALALAVFVTAPVAADWIVMTDGARLETQGPWSEKGKLVVFTDANGTLVSVRRSEVDMDASHRATREAVEAASRPAPPPPPPRESVFKLTDADVGHVDDEDLAGGEGETDEGADDPDAPPPPVSVIAWDRQDNAAGTGSTIRATLENQGADVAISLSVTVTIFDQDGVAIGTTAAQLGSTGLVSGQTTEMVAEFPDIFSFAAVTFDVQQRSIASRPMSEGPSVDGAVSLDGEI